MSKKSVLVVDDSPDGTILTMRALSKLKLDFHIDCVVSGNEALEFLGAAQEVPALILLDLKMPGMDGIETLKRIRADSRLAAVPVIITSLSTLESELAAAREAGAAGIVFKSMRLDVFTRDLGDQALRWLG